MRTGEGERFFQLSVEPETNPPILFSWGFVNPYVTVRRASSVLDSSRPTARKAI